MVPIALKHSGFTLIELMIAMAMSGIVLAGVYFAFASQQRSQLEQQLTTDLQQNTRAALFFLQREIRMAGFDPTWNDGNGDGVDDLRTNDGIDNDCDDQLDQDDPENDEADDIAGIVKAASDQIQIRLDRDGDSDFCSGDNLVAFGFPRKADGNRDGIADVGAAQLKRGFGRSGLNQPVAENVQAVAFAYAFDFDAGLPGGDGQLNAINGHIIWAYDSDGNGDLDMALDTNGDGVISASDDADGDGFINDLPIEDPAPLSAIRAVRLWVLARTRTPLRKYSDRSTYVVGDKILIPGDTNGNGAIGGGDVPDNFKRNLLVASVYCRNMGLRE